MRLHRLSSRSPIVLTNKLGKGGEGAVYGVHGDPRLVAKIYAKPPRERKVEKLRAMARAASPALLKVAAWPVEVLCDEQRVPRGFLMPRVAARHDVHELYSPKSRARTFPDVDFRFVVRAAANIARAFAVVHSHGHVIGDVNHGNVLIGLDATVMLIDCDSFQTRHADRTYPCDVGVPLFTAPELQGLSFRGLKRTQNHDVFGLAVTLFHLLYMGRHPFAGRYADGEMPIERAIAEFRFAYGETAESVGMQQPPGTLDLDAFGPETAALFSRAFSRDASTVGRPSAQAWVDVLSRLERLLVECREVQRHFHPAPTACAWCDLESRLPFRAFHRDEPLPTITPAEIDALWKSVTSIEPPPPPPILPLIPDGQPLASLSLFARGLFCFFGIAIGFQQPIPIAIVVVSLTLVLTFGVGRASPAKRDAVKKAEEFVKYVVSQWNEGCSSDSFRQVEARLQELRAQLVELVEPGRRQKEIVDAAREQYRRLRFLAQFRIEEALANENRGEHLMTLAAKRVHTAADLDRRIVNPGELLPEDVSQRLYDWYEKRVSMFTFDRETPMSADERQHAQLALHQEQEALLEQLRKGSQSLRDARASILKKRADQKALLDEACRALDEARKRA